MISPQVERSTKELGGHERRFLGAIRVLEDLLNQRRFTELAVRSHDLPRLALLCTEAAVVAEQQ